MLVTVCDSIMGSGKTQAAIAMMNASTDKRYIFVTQFLSEVQRVCEGCASRGFKSPVQRGEGKLSDLHHLLADKDNVASTHALFYKYNAETIDLVSSGHYNLILDEVIDVVKFVDVSPSDIKALFASGMISADDDNRLRWLADDYDGRWNDLRKEIETACVTFEENRLMMWTMPVELFAAFDSVTVLTYMFDSQYQAYYFNLNNVDIAKCSAKKCRDSFEFAPYCANERYNIPEIEIVSDGKLNAIGDPYYALSSTWHKTASGDDLAILKKNISNLFKNKWNCDSKYKLWTSYMSSKTALSGNGYTTRFLPFNTRATNDYRECTKLAYLVNVFPQTDVEKYFESRGFKMNRDQFALSSMVQWLWRSALRDDKPISLYIPSNRMRKILIDWIDVISD